MDTVFLAGKYGRGGPRRAHTRIIFIGHYLLNIAPFPFRFRPASVTLPFRFHPRPFRFRPASVLLPFRHQPLPSASVPLPLHFRSASASLLFRFQFTSLPFPHIDSSYILLSFPCLFPCPLVY